jgi:hypothetical protein
MGGGGALLKSACGGGRGGLSHPSNTLQGGGVNTLGVYMHMYINSTHRVS